MPLVLDIPARIESKLHEVFGDDLSRVALEALLIEGYRSAKLSLGQIAEVLGMTTIQADQFLAERGVPLNYSEDDLQRDVATLKRKLGS